MKPARGRFITVEGIDGAGKSTHVTWLAERIAQRGHEAVVTREPGGTALGERIRPILLAEAMDPETEALLMFAARNENLHQVIRPALERGAWVVCDRFTDATFAYQGAGKGVGLDRLAILEQWVHPGLEPDLTFLFDLQVASAKARLERVREPDKFERESADFFQRIRNGYLARAERAPKRMRIIDSSRPIELIRQELEMYLGSL